MSESPTLPQQVKSLLRLCHTLGGDIARRILGKIRALVELYAPTSRQQRLFTGTPPSWLFGFQGSRLSGFLNLEQSIQYLFSFVKHFFKKFKKILRSKAVSCLLPHSVI